MWTALLFSACSCSTPAQVYVAAVAAVDAGVVRGEVYNNEILLPGEQLFTSTCLGSNHVLQSYMTRHHRALDFLKVGGSPDAGRADEGNQRSTVRPKFLVWRCRDKSHMGGIGDRLKRLGGLFTAAVATNRVLLVDFADFSDVFLPRDFEWRFDVLEPALRNQSVGWWEYQGESEETDEVAKNGRRFANITSIPSTSFLDAETPEDFPDDVRDWPTTVMQNNVVLLKCVASMSAFARVCVCMVQVIVTHDGGSIPYLFGHHRDHGIRDYVERAFPNGFFEGCVFHAFFSARTQLRQQYAREVCIGSVVMVVVTDVMLVGGRSLLFGRGANSADVLLFSCWCAMPSTFVCNAVCVPRLVVLLLHLAQAARLNLTSRKVALEVDTGGATTAMSTAHRRRVVTVHVRAEDSIWSPAHIPHTVQVATTSLYKLIHILDCAFKHRVVLGPAVAAADDVALRPDMSAMVLVRGWCTSLIAHGATIK